MVPRNPSYLLVAADLGATLRVRVTASNATGPGIAATSNQSAVVAAAPAVTNLAPNPGFELTPTTSFFTHGDRHLHLGHRPIELRHPLPENRLHNLNALTLANQHNSDHRPSRKNIHRKRLRENERRHRLRTTHDHLLERIRHLPRRRRRHPIPHRHPKLDKTHHQPTSTHRHRLHPPRNATHRPRHRLVRRPHPHHTMSAKTTTRIVRAATVTAVVIASFLGGPTALAVAANPIATENALPGTTAWEPHFQGLANADQHALEGYASEVSVQPGDTVHLHVSTNPVARYRVEVYRLGWYGGTGGRLVGCTPSCTGDKQGTAYSIPALDSNGFVDPAWPVTDTFTIPANAVSGYYLAKLRLTSGSLQGGTHNIPVIVREPAGQNASALVIAPVNTWQAYNPWGGKSLYDFQSDGVAAVKVSFNRPYQPAHTFLEYDLDLIRWLEREGYDVSYTTDVDVDSQPGSLLQHTLVMTAGHDEYWSKATRDGLEAARDAGTNLAFMGANTGYWQVRHESAGRTLVEYRNAVNDPHPDPTQKTIRFRDLATPRPECELLGRAVHGWHRGRHRSATQLHGRLGHPERPLVRRHRLRGRKQRRRGGRVRVGQDRCGLRTLLVDDVLPLFGDAISIRRDAVHSVLGRPSLRHRLARFRPRARRLYGRQHRHETPAVHAQRHGGPTHPLGTACCAGEQCPTGDLGDSPGRPDALVLDGHLVGESDLVRVSVVALQQQRRVVREPGGATSRVVSAVAADLGSTLRVRVTASNATGPGVAVTSGQSAVVVAAGAVPVNSVPAGDHGHSPGGAVAVVVDGDVVWEPDVVCVSVVAL